ncbi:MAG: hypothetical protein IJV56_05790 [Neisseriaceae bacterium]|nr:hypothetical protein [Neisseriaceae bacterium]
MKKSLISLILALSVLNLSGCATALVQSIPDTKIQTQTEYDKLLAIGQIKSDGRFTVIGDKYLYVINNELLNKFLSNNMDALNQYYLSENQINIDIADGAGNQGKISFDLRDKNSQEVKSFRSEIELYNKTENTASQYVLNSSVAIKINKRYAVDSKGNQALSTILSPFAWATDIALIPVYAVGVVGVGMMMSPSLKGSSGSSSSTTRQFETSNPIVNKPYTPSTPPRNSITRTPSANMPSSNPRVRQMQQFKR